MQLINTRQFSDTQLIEQVSLDYLAFTLQFDLHDRVCDFQQTTNQHCHVSLLGNGIISFEPINAMQIDGEVIAPKSIILSCGVHGNETAPIEICNKIIHELLNGSLQTKHRVLFIFGNIPSMHIAERFVEENLNRLFVRDSKSNTQEGERAISLMNVVDAFFAKAKGEKLHYDLHTAIRPSKNEKFAVYPFLNGKPYSKEQLAFLSACDVNTILLSQSPTTTFSYYSSSMHNAHAFTVELGKVKPFGHNEMGRFVAINCKLRELISESTTHDEEFSQSKMNIYAVNQVINKNEPDFQLHFADDIANFTEFSQDEVIASETGRTYKALQDGEAVVFPNANVAIGQRAILTVVPHKI